MSRALYVLLLVTLTRAAAIGKGGQRDVFPGVGQYVFHGQFLTWTTAYETCRDAGGSLPIVNSVAKVNILKRLLVTYGVENIHLGFTDVLVEGEYKTIDDKALDDESSAGLWAPDEPTAGTPYNCGFLTTAGLGVGSCLTNVREFFCEIPLWYDYDTIEGVGHYKLYPAWESWTQAYEICYADGAHLLIINSQAEIDAVAARYPTMVNTWIGVHRLYGAEDFVTLLDQPLAETGYAVWAYPTEPDGDSLSKPYVVYSKSATNPGLMSHTGRWEGSIPFVCEAKPWSNTLSGR